MSKKSEVIAARRTALGLRVISNDTVEFSTPSMIKSVSASGITEIMATPVSTSRALVVLPPAAAVHSPSPAKAQPASSSSSSTCGNAIDTSLAYANHCNDGKRLTAADIDNTGKTAASSVAAPRTALERANGRLSLVHMSEHSVAS